VLPKNKHPFNILFSRTTWVSWHQKGYTNLDFNEARDDKSGCGISWTICKSFAPHSRQITTPAPYHSMFYRPDAFPDALPAVSKHLRQITVLHRRGLLLQMQ